MTKQLRGFIAAGWLALAAAFGPDTAGGSPAVQDVTFECSVKSNNDGCEKIIACPAGTKIRTAWAACNLEHGAVTDQQLSSVPHGYITVVRRSDRVDDARCWVGSNEVDGGQAAIAGIAGLTRVSVGCQEHDKNGGDCHIRGSLSCE